MKYIFIDESGSLTKAHAASNPEFVICLIVTSYPKDLRKLFRRFVENNRDELKKVDKDNKMFNKHKFIELKGSALPLYLKERFAAYLCTHHLFEVYYIHIDNKNLQEKFFRNTSICYNYFVEQAIENAFARYNLPFDDYMLYCDERNVQTISRNSLEDYLNIKLFLENDYVNTINVVYEDSKRDMLVQLADFFSNLYFSSLHRDDESKTMIEILKERGYIRHIYTYEKEYLSLR